MTLSNAKFRMGALALFLQLLLGGMMFEKLYSVLASPGIRISRYEDWCSTIRDGIDAGYQSNDLSVTRHYAKELKIQSPFNPYSRTWLLAW